MAEVTLGLDPGSSKIGWSIIGEDKTVLDCGFLSPVSDTPKSFPFNLKMNLLIRRLIPFFTGLLKKHKVTRVAWEIVPSFGQMSQRELVQATATTLKILTIQKGLPYQHFTPQSWHKKCLGQGKVTKTEVKSWVLENNPLLLDDMPFDVYDAIAIGLTATQLNEWITNEL
jgi:Holliday junction resolvasome RuvABC endonuclease subunit